MSGWGAGGRDANGARNVAKAGYTIAVSEHNHGK